MVTRRTALRGVAAGALATAGAVTASPAAHARSVTAQPSLPVAAGRQDVPTIVIGSGYGAAVAAARLTAAGVSVTMLEMGQDFTGTGAYGSMIAPNASSFWFKRSSTFPIPSIKLPVPYSAGVLDRVDFPNMQVYRGVGFGGGSIVNGGIAVMPRRDWLSTQLPYLDMETFFSTHLPRAAFSLGANSIGLDFLGSNRWYQYSAVAHQEATRAGFGTQIAPNTYDFDYMRKEDAGQVAKSALAGEVILGNNHGKRSLDKTYLAQALATGRMQVRTLRKVTSIRHEDDAYLVRAKVISPSGATLGVEEFRTPKVFLGAGSIGTTELLLKGRSTGELPGLNDQIGQYWGSNGTAMSARSLVSDRGGYQSTIPVLAIDNWNAAQNATFTEVSPLPLLPGLDAHTALYLHLTKNPARSTMTWQDGRLDLGWSTQHSQGAVAAAEWVTDRLNAANSGIRGRFVFPFSGSKGDLTYHPLGGAVIGQATDMAGRVHGQPGLYVIDGSLIPGSVGVNPFVTITALAEMCMDTVLAQDFTG